MQVDGRDEVYVPRSGVFGGAEGATALRQTLPIHALTTLNDGVQARRHKSRRWGFIHSITQVWSRGMRSDEHIHMVRRSKQCAPCAEAA